MKKITTVTALVFAAALSGLLAQCPVGNVNLFSQGDVDMFVATFPNCQQLDGNLTLGKMSSDSDIHDLSGFEKLSSISGSLTLLGMPLLNSLDGLQSLQTIGGDLSIIQNPELTSLNGLNALKEIQGSLTISFLGQLTSLQGLNNLETIGKDMNLNFTPSLADMTGVQSLKTIGGSLILDHNEFLLSFGGMNNLETIGVDLILRNNGALNRMDGLESLTTIGRDLRIGWEYPDGYTGNPSLTSLDGLASLSVIGGKIGIAGNENLSECAIDALCDFLSTGGPTVIKANASGCDSKEEVMQACGLTSTDEAIRQHLRVSPNPTYGQITLDSPYLIQSVRIFDATGQLKLESPNSNTLFDLSSFGPGLYLVRMQIEGREVLRRVVVQ
jgi:hypothetical protein